MIGKGAKPDRSLTTLATSRSMFALFHWCASARSLVLYLACCAVAAGEDKLRDCVERALEQDFTVRVQRHVVDTSKAAETIANSFYDPVLGLNLRISENQSAATISSINTGNDGQNPTTTLSNSSFSFSKKLVTGGGISFDLNLDRTASNISQSLLNPNYSGQNSIQLVQPLLKGAGRKYGKVAIQIAQKGTAIENNRLKSTALTVVYAVESSYYALAHAQKQMSVGQKARALAAQLLEEATEREQVGVSTELDVTQAQAGLATAEGMLLSYRKILGDAEDALLYAMGEREFAEPIGSIDLPVLPSIDISEAQSYKLAREKGPELALIYETIEQYKLEVFRAKRNTLPDLTFFAGGGYLSTQRSSGAAIGGLWPGSGYNWNTGLSLTVPVGFRNSKAQYRQTINKLLAEEIALEQADHSLYMRVRGAVRAVQISADALAAAKRLSEYDRKQFVLQKANFDEGLSTSYDVLVTLNQLQGALVAESQAEANLHISLAQLRMIEGTSLEFLDISFEP